MRRRDASVVWVILALAGCGPEAPPLDELPLRDALRADPEVVGALPDDARARLAARLEIANARDGVTDDVAGAGDDPAALAAAVDRARVARNADPLIVGQISAGIARPFTDHAGDGGAPPLPSLEGGGGQATADAERDALAGDAGATVRALMRASGAIRLRRVTGWPAGALAVGDTVYVNAAWLVARAPTGAGRPDAGANAAPAVPASGAGASARAAAPGATAPIAPGQETSALTSGSAGSEDPDGGVPRPPPTPPPPWPPEPPPDDGTSDEETCGASCDACDACAAGSSSCDDSSGDSCDDTSDDGSSDSCGGTTDDGSSDSCGGTTDDGSSDSCGGTTDDGSSDSCGGGTDDGAAGGCQVTGAHPRCRRGRPRGGSGTGAWLLMPFGFLMLAERRRGA